MPLGNIYRYRRRVLPDRLACQLPQETGDGSQGQEGQSEERRGKQQGRNARRVERPGKKAVGRDFVAKR